MLVRGPSRAVDRHAATSLLVLQPLQGVYSGQSTSPQRISESSYSIVQCRVYTIVCRQLRIALRLSLQCNKAGLLEHICLLCRRWQILGSKA